MAFLLQLDTNDCGSCIPLLQEEIAQVSHEKSSEKRIRFLFKSLLKVDECLRPEISEVIFPFDVGLHHLKIEADAWTVTPTDPFIKMITFRILEVGAAHSQS